jgi:allantoicase
VSKKIGNPFHEWIRLEQPRLGTSVVFATDDFFADKSRLIDPGKPVFIEDKFDDNGKWMDGWESRRKRVKGHDHCVIRLGVPGVIQGLDIDTSHFTGNYPPEASVEACVSDKELPGDSADWQEIQSKTSLQGDSHHYLPVSNDSAFTHVRLHIYPDGGVARLRIYGEVTPDWSEIDTNTDTSLDLFALENGGRSISCNDEHFGSMHNLNLPGRGINMGDGWETARRREPGNDWVILALGHPGVIELVEVDTAHFKGNYPDRVSLQAAMLDEPVSKNIDKKSQDWPELLPQQKLKMDTQHLFEDELNDLGVVSHVRLSIFPDGGVSRLRLFGKPSRQ